MMKAAKIVDGVVTEILIMQSGEFPLEICANGYHIIDNDVICGIGWLWNGEKFTPPENEEIPMEE